MFRGGIFRRGPHSGFPRVSGDVPLMGVTQRLITEFSPRERGCS